MVHVGTHSAVHLTRPSDVTCLIIDHTLLSSSYQPVSLCAMPYYSGRPQVSI